MMGPLGKSPHPVGAKKFHNNFSFFFFFFFLPIFFRAVPTACEGSQARDVIGAVAANLHRSHSNTGSEPCLQPAPQFTATPDP